jgi:cytochrome c-type biogenesis protein CcsB
MCYNPGMHVVLLRLALGLYSVGLLHSVLSVLNKKHVIFRTALVAVTTGFACHVASIMLRGVEVGYLPITQGYEAFSFFAAIVATGFLIAYAKYRIAQMSVFVFPLIFIMTFIANLFYDPSGSIPNILHSNWIYIHTSLLFLGYAALFIAFTAAVMYLLQEREIKSKHPTMFHNRLPSLQMCDDLAYRSLSIGFPLITLGIISGALWAQKAWGTIWGGDFTVSLSLLSWLIYLVLIHYRLIAGWRGRKAAYLSIIGFMGILAMLLGASSVGVFHHPL